MKNRTFIGIFILAMSALTWQGCNKTEDLQKGTLDFGLNPLTDQVLKSSEADRHDVVGALVTIVGVNGEVVYDKHLLHFYSFGESFVTEKLSLDPGAYLLTEFLLVDTSGTVTWATPLENSRLAYLVDHPLPIEFHIESNSTTHLIPQVVRVGNYQPGDFGYVNFEVEFIERFCIGVFFKSECDWYNDSIMTAEGDFAPIYQSRFIVLTGDRVIMEVGLVPDFNRIVIPRGYEVYTFMVLDCKGEKCYVDHFRAAELRQFSCSEGEPLYIMCGETPSGVIVTPEDIMEPTIEQGVFGRFMISYTDSTTNEYFANPVIRDLHIFRIGDDANIDDLIWVEGCIVYPVTDVAPDVIVRSNSSGYFETKLEAGRYLYMVQSGGGYYIDMFISSRIPGELVVHEGEVTNLDIYIQPCYDY